MSSEAEHPFNGYTLYKVFHKGEGRFYAQLVNKETKHRTTISYARYLMSVSLGRLLGADEHVDHINGDKTCDILTPYQNTSKYSEIDNPSESIPHTCPNCGIDFTRPKNRSYKFLKFGKSLFCSRKCSYENLSKKQTSSFVRKQESVIEEIQRLRSEGMSSYKISETLGIARNTVMKYW